MKLKLTATAAAIAVLSTSACTDPASLSPDSVNRNTLNGALLGGVLGAGVTKATGGDTQNVVAATAAGAVVGGLIGNRLDQQEAALKSQLANEDIQVTNTGDSLIVSLPQDITFATDSYTVREDLKTDLQVVAQNLVAYPDSSVQVIGHTDSEGDATYNLGLSQRRANSVADVLQAQGVTYNRLLTTGRGEDQPVASNLTEEGRSQNRRVEIVVMPTTS
jgi:outer membrane protein OmpA-like peptidoglycan-associated protein